MSDGEQALAEAVDEACWPAVEDWWRSTPLPNLLARPERPMPPMPDVVRRMAENGLLDPDDEP